MPRLLILEDEPDSREILELALSTAGFDVVAVPTSAAGKQQLERGAFDLVLADLVLESKDIADSVKLVRGLRELARPAPLGLLTGWPLSHEKVAELDVAFALKKPCSRDELIGQLATTLELPPVSEGQLASLRGYFKAIEAHDYATLAKLVTEDVVYQLPGMHVRLSNEIRGRDAFIAFTAETFSSFRRPTFELGTIRPLPHGALVEYVGHWFDELDQPRSLPGTVMFEMRDNFIARIAVRVDPDQIS